MYFSKEISSMFRQGLQVNQPGYQFFPNESSSGLYFFWAILCSPILFGGPIAWIVLEVKMFLTDSTLWHERFQLVLQAPTNSPGLFIFTMLLAILFFIGFPVWGVYLWKLYFLHRKLRQMEKSGLFQYGVYLDETKLLIRVYDKDEELVEQHIERSSIHSVKEIVTSYTSSTDHITTKKRSILVTWMENQKSWYIAIDEHSLHRESFIELGLALGVEPAESYSVFKG